MFIGSIDHALTRLTKLNQKPRSLEARNLAFQIKRLRSLREEGVLAQSIQDSPFSALLGIGGEIAFPVVGLRLRGHLSKHGRRLIRISDFADGRMATYSFSKAGLRRAVSLIQAEADRQVRKIMGSWEPARLPLTSLKNSRAEAARNQRKLGGAIARRRVEKGWSRTDLAEKIKVSSASLARLEAGKDVPTNFRLALIAKLLGVCPFELLYDTSLGKYGSRPIRRC